MIAHEAGHLLLGAGHSVTGIMHSPWSVRDRALAAQGNLLFPRKDAKRMRAALRNRALGAPTAAAVDSADLKITVYVYNHAKVPAEKLEQSRREVVRIYREGGVEVDWVGCACSAGEKIDYPDCRAGEPRKDWVAIQIVTQVMMDRWRRESSKFGMAALSEDGEFRRYASVCAECAEQLVKAEPRRSGPLLGYLIAHEVGHLLLGTPRHSAFGVMRSTWNRADLEDSGRGRMFLSRPEAGRICDRVRERMWARETVNAIGPGSRKYLR